jgi:hypothetical protein
MFWTIFICKYFYFLNNLKFEQFASSNTFKKVKKEKKDLEVTYLGQPNWCALQACNNVHALGVV